jgi:hypothetical protein
MPEGLWLHAACRPVAVAANNLVGQSARFSLRLVPGRRVPLALPFGEDVLGEIRSRVEGWRATQDVAMMSPADARRARAILMPLDLEGRPTAFVKVTQDPPNPLTVAIFDGLKRLEPGFLFPRIREVFQVGEWWVTLEDPLPQVRHKPARPGPGKLHSVVSSIHELVSHEQGDLRPAHGDLGPWNVREYVGVGLAILDWEYAAWAPVATDEVWHAITLRLATSRRSGESAGVEAHDELRAFYSDAQLRDAAEFLANRWEEGEPVEIREAMPKSKSLLRSERRLAGALGQFMD